MATDFAAAIESVVSDLKASEGRISTKLTALQHALDAAGVDDPAVAAAVADLTSEAGNIASIVSDDASTNGAGAASPAAPVDTPPADEPASDAPVDEAPVVTTGDTAV